MSDWKSIVATVAPTVATMLGGPLAGVAVKALSEKLLGRPDGSEADVSAAVAALGPADLIRLKEIEADITKTLADNDIKLEQVASADRDSARRRAVDQHDYTPNALAIILLGLFGWVLQRLMDGQPIGQDSQMAMMMIGGLIAATQQALNYFLGTTKASADKTKALTGLANNKP